MENNAYITFTAIIEGMHVKKNKVCRIPNFTWSGISNYAEELKKEMGADVLVITQAFRLKEKEEEKDV